ncbi:MAG TPA: ABC transporter permease, partial [Candidatus Angelobacter sp.]|nr:ABC transporter permease [Candidatus Angelobacter sp.]
MSETVTSRKGITWREPAVIALETLRTHKLRSFLTLLGVILSVATLIVVISMIRGTDQYISDKVANFGANVFLVSQFPYVVTREELVRLQRRNKPILWDDYQYLQQNMSTAKAVSYEMVRGTAVARYANLDIKDVLLDGVTPNLAEMGKVEPALGRYISDADNEHRAEVALIGDDVAKRFFLGVDPLGKTISVDGRPYQVIGVAKPLGSSFGFSQDKFVYIPVLTYRKIYGTQQSGTMKVQARGPQWMAIAQDEARMLMRSLRHVKPNEDDNFELIEPSSLMGLWSALTDTI